MELTKLKEEIKNKVSEILRIEADIIDDNSRFDTLDNWDSMANVIILSTMEEVYEVEFPESQLFNLNTVSALANQIQILRG